MLGHAARRDKLAMAGGQSRLIYRATAKVIAEVRTKGRRLSQLTLDPGRARVGKGKFGND